jgi:hypothetical protein
VGAELAGLVVLSGASEFSLITGMGPAAAATSFMFTADYAAIDRPVLIDSAAGDALVLTQFAYRTTPINHWAATRAATVLGVDIENAQASTIVANFSPLVLTDLSLDWRTSEFENLASSVHPTAITTAHRLYFDPVPGGLSHGHFANGPIVAFLERAVGAGNLSMTLRFGNPYPDAEVSPAYLVEYELDYQLPNATPLAVRTTIRHGSSIAAINGIPLSPALSPPQAIRINGQAATSNLTGVGTRPVIAWSAPSIGTPGGYAVSLYELSNVAGETRQTFIASVRTRQTSVEMPPGLMAAGRTYFMIVSAIVSGTVDLEATPFLRGYPERISPSFTELVSP